MDRTASSPKISGLQSDPSVVEPGQDLIISWNADDGDADDLRAILLLKPTDSDTWIPYGVQLDGNQATIPGSWLAGWPGSYDARVLVSDGINTVQIEQRGLFTVKRARIFLPIILRD